VLVAPAAFLVAARFFHYLWQRFFTYRAQFSLPVASVSTKRRVDRTTGHERLSLSGVAFLEKSIYDFKGFFH